MTGIGGSLKNGDIVVVDGHGEALDVRRLALVVSIEEENNHLQVMLCHEDLELASIVDATIRGFESGLSYDLVVETDLHSVIWKSQVTKTIGKIVPDLVNKVLAHAADPDSLVDGIRAGYTIQGVMDPRWKFKEIEGQQFRNLCAHCVSSLLSKEPVTIDLDIFKLCDENEIYRFLLFVKDKKIMLSQKDQNEMEKIGLCTKAFWKERFPSGGLSDAIHKIFVNLIQVPEQRVESFDEQIVQGRIRDASVLLDVGFPIVTSRNLWINFESTLETAPRSLHLLAV